MELLFLWANPCTKTWRQFRWEKISKLKSKEQIEIIEVLRQGSARRKELRERGFSSTSENSLIKKGLVKLFNENIESRKFYENANEILKETPPKPNLEQQNAILTISNCHGLIPFTKRHYRVRQDRSLSSSNWECFKKGKAVLILVPEIALTPQTFDRFYRRFNVPVSSMHSALSDRERLDAYIDMATSKSGILIGTRTALFTPIPNLGLIVIDEEHDSSFKQNDSFRYHARNLAIMRAKLNNCPIVLGSATPSLETIYNVQKVFIKRLTLQ